MKGQNLKKGDFFNKKTLLTNKNFRVSEQIFTKKLDKDKKFFKRQFVVQNLKLASIIKIFPKAFRLKLFKRNR